MTAVLAFSGCGTIRNLSTRPSVYGGIQEAWSKPPGGLSGSDGLKLVVLFPLAIVDLPLSLAADTVVLPVTISCAEDRTASPKPATE